MQDYEKLGVFYLGRRFDLGTKRPVVDDLLLYDAKDLTTHAVCVGMTGSGKTGLCLSLLEEAAIDGIPAICIDPKGDLGNLLLAFPNLSPGDFRPWIDPADATRAGMTLDEFATKMAQVWKDGLAAWDQPQERIARYRDAVDISIYTPASNAGLPLTVLRSFAAPSASTLGDSEAMRERVTASASGLLALLGLEADSLQSREHILLSTILDRSWRDGKDIDLGMLIRLIQKPNFDKVGFMDLESFFPSKDRFALAMTLNNLIASPGFQAWMEGESLDIQRLLYTPEGKPRLTILSIAHLSDSERMFFVTILLNEMLAWMRNQSGTSSLRAILYMDEVFGYFPPSANPPSKTPMLTLLKQARAFGLGVVLATQNPVDLDYKGLSNAGTWFLGRLQTERDKARVLEGLEGASAAAGANFDRGRMEKILAGLGNRVFLMNNVHEDEPVVFQSRWALSYLRGPVSREQIATLMSEKKTRAAGGVRLRQGIAGRERRRSSSRSASGNRRNVHHAAKFVARNVEVALSSRIAGRRTTAIRADDGRDRRDPGSQYLSAVRRRSVGNNLGRCRDLEGCRSRMSAPGGGGWRLRVASNRTESNQNVRRVAGGIEGATLSHTEIAIVEVPGIERDVAARRDRGRLPRANHSRREREPRFADRKAANQVCSEIGGVAGTDAQGAATRRKAKDAGQSADNGRGGVNRNVDPVRCVWAKAGVGDQHQQGGHVDSHGRPGRRRTTGRGSGRGNRRSDPAADRRPERAIRSRNQQARRRPVTRVVGIGGSRGDSQKDGRVHHQTDTLLDAVDRRRQGRRRAGMVAVSEYGLASDRTAREK
jgi:hypothetical protein